MTARHWQRGGAAALAFGIVTSALFTCSLVHAQAWLPDRQYTEGPGFKAGLFEIHPGIAVRGGYDSNVFNSDGDQNPTIGSGLISVSPHLNISTRKRQRLEGGEGTLTALPKIRLNTGLSGSFFYYTADDTPDPNMGVDFDGTLEVMPEAVVGGVFSAAYQRAIRPFTEQGASNYVRNDFSVLGALKFQSRGGVLSGRVGYKPEFTLFPDSNEFNYLNNITHTVPVNMGWKFLPHTAMLYDAEIGLRSYMEDPSGTDVLFSDSKAFRSRLGINGALTSTVVLQLMAGAAFGFYDETSVQNSDTGAAIPFQFDEFQEPIGQASLTWAFGGRKSKLELSYQHEVQASFVGAWVKRDRGDIQLNLNLLSMFGMIFEIGGGQYRYGNMIGADGEGLGEGGDETREDLRLDGAIRAEYRATNWLAFMADFAVTISDTDFVYANEAGLPVDPASFNKFEVFGGVRAHY